MDRFCLVLFVLFTTILSLVIFISAHPNVIVSWTIYSLKACYMLEVAVLFSYYTVLSLINAMSPEYLKQDQTNSAAGTLTNHHPYPYADLDRCWILGTSLSLPLTFHPMLKVFHSLCIALPGWSSCHCSVWELRLCAFHGADHIRTRTFLHGAPINYPKNESKN